MRSCRASLVAFSTLAVLLAGARVAHASNVTEFPDNGSEQMARGGAWIARASDPLATAFNPAGLAGQESRITLQSNFLVQHTCFTRLKAANDTSFGSADTLLNGSGHYPRVCNDIEPTFNPQLALSWRVSERLGLGIAVL